MRYDIVDLSGNVIAYDVLPTPRLVDEGTRGVVEAFDHEGIWRVRDDAFDAKIGPTYQRVRVRVTRIPDPFEVSRLAKEDER